MPRHFCLFAAHRYFTHCCPTRWVGILNTFGAIDHNWEHLVTLKAKLIKQGMGPTNHPVATCDTPKCKRSTELKHGHNGPGPMGATAFCSRCWKGKAVAANDKETGSDGGEDDGTDAGKKKKTALEKAYPGVAWKDARPTTAYALLAAMKDNEVGDISLGPTSKKRSVFLDPCVGITILNAGLMKMVLDALAGYKDFVVRMQTTSQPVQARVYDQIKLMLDGLGAWPAPGLAHFRYPARYGQWRQDLLPKGYPGTDPDLHPHLHLHWLAEATRGKGHYLHAELVLLVDGVAKAYTTKVRDSIAARLQPYMKTYAGMSLIDLRFDRTTSDEAMAGLQLICKRYPTLDAIKVADDLRRSRAALMSAGGSGTLSAADEKSMKLNLYNFYFIHMAAFKRDYPALWIYVQVIFSLPFATAVVESLFSRVNANKTKTRNALGEDTLHGGLHAKDAVSPHKNPTTKDQPLVFFDGIVKLNSYRAREHELSGGWGL